jgi:hypothetical protein
MMTSKKGSEGGGLAEGKKFFSKAGVKVESLLFSRNLDSLITE